MWARTRVAAPAEGWTANMEGMVLWFHAGGNSVEALTLDWRHGLPACLLAVLAMSQAASLLELRLQNIARSISGTEIAALAACKRLEKLSISGCCGGPGPVCQAGATMSLLCQLPACAAGRA